MTNSSHSRVRLRHVLTLVLVLILTSSAWGEICRGSKIKKAELADYDQAVSLTQEERSAAIKTHMPFGGPRCPKLLPHREFIVCYDPDQRVTLWVSYKLTREDAQAELPRRDAFRTDPRLTENENAHCSDYYRSGYDRGHMIPRGDMNRSSEAQANTFFFSNMTPQTPLLNRGMWRWLEESVRAYAIRYDTVYILAGSVFQDERTLPSGRVAIPTRLYKVVIRGKPERQLLILAFLLPNRKSGLPVPPGTRGIQGRRVSVEQADAYLARQLVSVERLAHLTGLNLLPKINREELRRAVASELWPRN